MRSSSPYICRFHESDGSSKTANSSISVAFMNKVYVGKVAKHSSPFRFSKFTKVNSSIMPALMTFSGLRNNSCIPLSILPRMLKNKRRKGGSHLIVLWLGVLGDPPIDLQDRLYTHSHECYKKWNRFSIVGLNTPNDLSDEFISCGNHIVILRSPACLSQFQNTILTIYW